MFWWTYRALGRNWSGLLQIYQGHVLVTLMYFDRISAGEEKMIEHFRDAYRKYLKSTGRLFPRVDHDHGGDPQQAAF